MKNEKSKLKCELYNDNFQNWKKYPIQKAQLVICDIPYNIGRNFYCSRIEWNQKLKNGELKNTTAAFSSDYNFNIAEYFHFCNSLLRKEDKNKVQVGRSSNSPCMIVFCSFEQANDVIEYAKKHGFQHHIPLVFVKNFSAQVLKANQRIVNATEYAIVLYRDKLPKFRNDGKMVFNWFNWVKDDKSVPKIHPTQKPVGVLKRLIEIFTDEGDIVIDPCAGSGSTLRAAKECGRNSYGFEINKDFYKQAQSDMLCNIKTEKKLDHKKLF